MNVEAVLLSLDREKDFVVLGTSQRSSPSSSKSQLIKI